MKDTNEDYIEIVKGVAGGLIILVLIVWFFLASGCKLLSEVKKDRTETKTDSSGVKKETEMLSKVDTSKSKSESAYTKEIFYYGRDTTINNFIFQPNQPSVYIKESGTRKDETQNYNYEQRLRQSLDSMRISELEKQLNKETKTEVKIFDFWQILALGIIGVIVLYLIANKFITIKK